jgi:hypothetical protein
MKQKVSKQQEAQPAKLVAETVILPDGPFNLREAAFYLRQKPRTIRSWMLRGLPCVRVTSKVLLFNRKDIDEWLEKRRTAVTN